MEADLADLDEGESESGGSGREMLPSRCVQVTRGRETGKGDIQSATKYQAQS